MPNKPVEIGITGGIGAGKSIISKIFLALGIPVYDADSRAKWLIAHDADLKDEIIQLLGEQAYVGGAYNSEYVAKTVFGTPEKLQQLNAAVHPRVANDYAAWLDQHNGKPYVLKEAALLFETGSYQSLNKVILVSAPEALRISRVVRRDKHRTEEDVRKIIKQQWSEEKKIRLSDEVILNDESTLVIPQVLMLHQKFLQQV